LNSLVLPDKEEPAVADPLGSMDSIITTSDSKCVIAVNAGSSTVASFAIGNDGYTLISTGVYAVDGSLPVSVAESNGNVVVLSARGKGAITGFKLEGCALTRISGITLDQDSQPEPQSFVTTPSQVGFTPDGRKLIVIIKIDGGIFPPPTPEGSMNVYDVDPLTGEIGSLTKTTLGEALPPFSFDFDSDDKLLVTSALNSQLQSYDIASNGAADFLDAVPIVGELAACWVKYSSESSCAVVSNNGSASLSTIAVTPDGNSLIKSVAASLAAPTDISFSPDQKYIYALSTGAGTEEEQPKIYAYRVNSGCDLQEIQVIDEGLPTIFTTRNGMAGLTVGVRKRFGGAYSMTNSANGNEVVVFKRDIATGELEFSQTVSAGGVGFALLNSLALPDKEEPAVADPLGSMD
jgi:6-phosphogluconolactonase (cycloisomerase 2 family)